MITIFHICPKGFNVGNDVITLNIKSLIYKNFGRVVNVINIPATSRWDGGNAGISKSSVHQINRYGDGVVIGGGNLFENNELDIDMQALEALKPPLMVCSVSRGRIYNRFHELEERSDVMSDSSMIALARKSAVFLSRDEATHEHMEKICPSKSRLAGCPTIFTSELLSFLPNLPQNEYTGALISIRTPQLMNIPARLQSGVAEHIRGLIHILRDEGINRVRLLCHDLRDLDFASSFTGVDPLYTSDVYEYLALLKNADINISFRLHATLPALSMGTNSIKITYDERALSLIKTLGLQDIEVNYVLENQDLLPRVKQLLGSKGRSSPIEFHSMKRILDSKSELLDGFSKFARLVRLYIEN